MAIMAFLYHLLLLLTHILNIYWIFMYDRYYVHYIYSTISTMAFILLSEIKWNPSGPFLFAQPRKCWKMYIFLLLTPKTLSRNSDNSTFKNYFKSHLSSKYQAGCMNKTQKSYSTVYSSMAECWGSWSSCILCTKHQHCLRSIKHFRPH